MLVTAVADPSLSARGIVPGVEVIAIDDVPVRQYAAEQVEPFESASSPQDLTVRTYTYSLLRGRVGEAVRLGLVDAHGTRWTEAVVRPAAPAHAAAEAEVEMRQLGNGVLYVNLRSFGEEKAADEFEKHFDEVRAAKALVLDVRENGGGSSSVGGRILATLLEQPALTSRSALTEYVATYRAWGDVQMPKRMDAERLAPNPKLHFTGRVAVLEGPETYSAAEDFLVAYATSGRGLLVGEASGGSTGQPLSFTLPGGIQARVCTKHDSFPDGREFVGAGVQPTIAVHNTVDDVRAGRDAVLERAVSELLK